MSCPPGERGVWKNSSGWRGARGCDPLHPGAEQKTGARLTLGDLKKLSRKGVRLEGPL